MESQFKSKIQKNVYNAALFPFNGQKRRWVKLFPMTNICTIKYETRRLIIYFALQNQAGRFKHHKYAE
jgi:hypothetical protein